MENVWFCLLTGTLALYVVFDGFDLGAGAIHLFVARTSRERRLVLRTIGPVWDGNEVWLLAAGGTVYFAFPSLYAASFSGFYLPLMIVLWLLILRGIAIEFRSHLDSAIWVQFWDAVFSGASILLVLNLGAALGNVVRGVPLDSQGRFFEPLWTDFRVGAPAGILDWYTISVGGMALAALLLHGSLWVALKTEGPVRERSLRVARTSWVVAGVMTALITALTFVVQPGLWKTLAETWWTWLFPLTAVAGWAGARAFLGRELERRAFLASCLYLAGLIACAAVGIHPYVLPAIGDPAHGLTAAAAAAPDYGLKVGLAWWLPGMTLVAGYFVYVYRSFAGKVQLDEGGY